MTQRVVVIHGGNAYATYAEYIAALTSAVLDEASLAHTSGWKQELAHELGDAYEVIAPRMPNAQNAKYREWTIWFEKHVPLLGDDVILIGHSLGGVFLARYLNERAVPMRIAGTLLVAAPYDHDGEHPLPEFAISGALDQFARQGGAITLYHSSDDPVVAYREAEKYVAALPDAQLRTFSDRQHFNQDTFPEICADIRALSRAMTPRDR